MTAQRLLLLGLTLTASACPGDDNVTTGGSTGDTDAESTESTTGTPSTDPPTTVPTTETTDPTTGTSVDPSTTGETSIDPSTTGETSIDPSTTGGTTLDDTTSGTTGDDTTSGTTGGTTTGTTSDGTTSGTTGDGTTSGTTGDGTTSGTTDTGDTTTDALDDLIYDIQNGTIKTGDPVDVQNVIVTAIATTKSGFMAQELDGGEFSGCWVFTGMNGPDISGLEVGDEVNITGITAEFNGLTEIDASGGTVVETGLAGVVIDPEVLPIATFTDMVLAEPWEGVHVQVVGDLTVSMLLPGEEFIVADGGTARVDNLAYSVFGKPEFPDFQTDASFTSIAGPLNFSVDAYKILPRSAADLLGYMPPLNPVKGVESLVAGDLVVTEIMYNPSCANDDCEWIEVFNATAQPVELLGLIIQDSQQNPNAQGKVTTSAVVAPGGFAVLGFKTLMTWPYPNPPAAFYGSAPALNNGAPGDTVFLKNSMLTIDATSPYVGKMGDIGVSWKLDPAKTNSVDNDTAANWCYSSNIFFMAEKGSPAMANEVPCSMN